MVMIPFYSMKDKAFRFRTKGIILCGMKSESNLKSARPGGGPFSTSRFASLLASDSNPKRRKFLASGTYIFNGDDSVGLDFGEYPLF